MKRAIILMMDSFGIGSSDDADQFGDRGADTLGHIAAACRRGDADAAGRRSGPLKLANLTRWGLAEAARMSTGATPAGLEFANGEPIGRYGYAVEQSRGKDTPSGHWELAGVPVLFDWGYFPRKIPCFPDNLIAALVQKAGLPGVLGNQHASGTEIIKELGAEHLRNGRPIVYTSGDSVFQIAAHEENFGLDRLYETCEIARALIDPLNIARVIARPFVGSEPENFQRTGNRRDYSVPPPAPTLLDRLIEDGGEVIAIGKIADIYAHQGIGQSIKADGNERLFDATLQALRGAGDRSLIFTNFVDFDQLYGHRRDVIGYAQALEDFDLRLPELRALLQDGDVVFVTADHGCDPSWTGSDHTREHVPAIAVGPGLRPGSIGRRESFADIGQSIAAHLGLPALPHGKSFLN